MAAPVQTEIPQLLKAPSNTATNSDPTWWGISSGEQLTGGNYATNKVAAFSALALAPSMEGHTGAGDACQACRPALTHERLEEKRKIDVKEIVRRAALELMREHRKSVANAHDLDMKSDEAIDEVVKVSIAIEQLVAIDRQLEEYQSNLRTLAWGKQSAKFEDKWLDTLVESSLPLSVKDISECNFDEWHYRIAQISRDDLKIPHKRIYWEENGWWEIIGMAKRHADWRHSQRVELAKNIEVLYRLHPFFSNTLPSLISRVGTAPPGETVGPAFHIDKGYKNLLNAIDDVVEKIASDDIDPLQLPMAVEFAKSRMNDENISLLNELLKEHEQNETLKNVGLVFSLGFLGTFSALGKGVLFAAAGDAANLGGALLFAGQIEEHLDRGALESASGNPDHSLLGVPATSGGDTIMLLVNGVLTSLGLLGLARGINGQMKLKLGSGNAPKRSSPKIEVLPPSKQLTSGKTGPARRWDRFTGQYETWPQRGVVSEKASGPWLERVGAPNSKSEIGSAALTPKTIVTTRSEALPPKLTAGDGKTSSGKTPLPDTTLPIKSFPKKPVAWTKPNKPNEIIRGVINPEEIPTYIAAWDSARIKGSTGNGSPPVQAQIFLHESPISSTPKEEPSLHSGNGSDPERVWIYEPEPPMSSTPKEEPSFAPSSGESISLSGSRTGNPRAVKEAGADSLEEGAILEPYAENPDGEPFELIVQKDGSKFPAKPKSEVGDNEDIFRKYIKNIDGSGNNPRPTVKGESVKDAYWDRFIQMVKAVRTYTNALAERLGISKKRIKVMRIASTEAGFAQDVAAGGIDIEAQITRADGSDFAIDGFYSLNKKEYLFQEHKEIMGLWENSVYSSPDGLSKALIDKILRNREIANEFKISGCRGWFYSTNNKELADLLAQALHLKGGPIYTKGHWEVLQMYK